MPAQHTHSVHGPSLRPAVDLNRQLERSGSWEGQLQTSAEDAYIYTDLVG